MYQVKSAFCSVFVKRKQSDKVDESLWMINIYIFQDLNLSSKVLIL